MKILLTNDDGIHAPGLWALHKRLAPRHSVTVVAPDREQSAVGHGISLHNPLRASRVCANGACTGYAVSGTPADCIKMGITEILQGLPDLVVAGINPGANVGVNVNYSGTVAAAREAALYGIPALAVSVQGGETFHYDEIAGFMEDLVVKVGRRSLPFGTVLNVNFPNRPLKDIHGVRVSSQDITRLTETFIKRRDPRNRTYYWTGGDSAVTSDDPGSDGRALELNCISITPLKCDMTDYSMLEELKKWDIENDFNDLEGLKSP